MRRVQVTTPSTVRRNVTTYIHMTALAVRYESRRMRRFERRDESRMALMDELRERIERDEYAVDADKVADAIVRKLMHVAAPPRG
jgi:anti-sigma28 factor (negative regulator of flagellin synthesis)